MPYLTYLLFYYNRREAEKDKLIAVHAKVAAAAEASALKYLDRAKQMRQRHTTFRDKKDKQIKNIKAQAKKKAATVEKSHNKELERQKSQFIRESRADSKRVVALASELEDQKRSAVKDLAELHEQYKDEINNVKNQCAAKMSKARLHHESEKRQLQSEHYREARASMKDKVALEAKLEVAATEKEQALAEKDLAVAEAVKETRAEERKIAAEKVSAEKDKASSLTSRLADSRKLVASLLDDRRKAERDAKKSSREANQSAQRSKSVIEAAESYRVDLERAENENATLRAAMEEMQSLLDEQNRRIEHLDKAVPIKVIQKTREGRAGRPRWGLDVWELILEQLVNGTPPSSVNDNIIAHVKKFSPTTKIKELPSIWTIRRARTVLLVIVQTLAAYRLGFAGKWGQLNHDATQRRQISFENLVISVEEDELFQ